MKRACKWVNLNNPIYVKYHDEEWGVPSYDDNYLFEMLVLESFQAGLTWETILNKRKYFRSAYDNFDVYKVCKYNEKKITELINNKNIIRNRLKILASIENAKVFINIINEFGSFSNYIWHFTKFKQIRYKRFHTNSVLSDKVSSDLKNRGMKFVGSKIIYSYLEAIGVFNNHSNYCYKYEEEICINFLQK